MKKEELKKVIINNLQEGSENEIKKEVEKYFNNLLILCFDELLSDDQLKIINNYCDANGYNNYFKNNNDVICAFFNNNAVEVLNFINSSNYNKYNDLLTVDGYGHLKSVSKWDVINLHKSDVNFLNYLKDNEILEDYEALKEEKENIIKEIKEEAKKIFIKVDFILYQKDFNRFLWDHRFKEVEEEPERVHGLIKIKNNHEYYYIYYKNDLYQLEVNQIKKVIGYNSIINNFVSLQPVASLAVNEKILPIRKHNDNERDLVGVGSWSYIMDNLSGCGCDGELSSYYVSVLKDWIKIAIDKDGNIYDIRANTATIYHPENATQSEKTRAKITKAFNEIKNALGVAK